MINVHIGVDDVDSVNGGCTTHYAVKLAWMLYSRGVKFLDYPNIVRLNPAIPWKTRGNGAVALRLLVESEDSINDIWELARNMLDEYSGFFKDSKKQPGLILHTGDIPWFFKFIAEKSLYDLVPLDLVDRLLVKSNSTRVYSPSGRRGLIGAVAAVGYTMETSDHTYELLAYRKQEYWGRRRCVSEESVIAVDREYGDYLILNYDYEYGRVLITPRGPDPVLLGLRGEDPTVLLEAYRKLEICEPVEYTCLFRTNQHTDAHLHIVGSICSIRPYMCVKVNGVVSSRPVRIPGGHVVFKICSGGCCIDVAVYEPTKSFRDIVEKLREGDLVEVMGCTRPPSSRHGLTINLEKIVVREVARVVGYVNPKCPRCGGTMESVGRGKGFRCRRCGFRDQYASKTPVYVERDLKPGIYEPPRIAFKHLMKPISRFGREKKVFSGVLVDGFIQRVG